MDPWKKQLDFEILPQPDDTTCGPTCLQALYRYYGDEMALPQVIAEVPKLEEGGTLGVLLGCHALSQGYRALLYTYNLMVFDPTWFSTGEVDLVAQLEARRRFKRERKLRTACQAYLDFLGAGGEVKFQDLTASLIRRYLTHSIPILTGLSATYLYRCARERGSDYDDVRGDPMGHFVVLCGYDRKSRTVRVADPLLPNPVSPSHQYEVNIHRVISAILLGVLTYDANLLIITPQKGIPVEHP